MSTAVNDGRVINVEHAEIRTATVAIRALTIDKRQVTLAVFRQLRDEPVVDRDTGEFRGLPWGTVNYHPDKCSDMGTHLHVVWQLGNELRRAGEYEPPERFMPNVDPEYVNGWLVLALNEGWRPHEWRRGHNGRGFYCRVSFALDLPDFTCSITPSGHNIADTGLAYAFGGKDDSFIDGYREAATDYVATLAAEYRANGHSRQRIEGTIIDRSRWQRDIWRARTERWQELRALPQLFIAT